MSWLLVMNMQVIKNECTAKWQSNIFFAAFIQFHTSVAYKNQKVCTTRMFCSKIWMVVMFFAGVLCKQGSFLSTF